MKFFLRLINSDLRSELKEYRAQFWTPGLVSYRDSGYGVALLKKDTMDKMLPSFLGCPVVIQHKDGSAEEIAASGQAVGKITEALWNPETGWYDCKFTVEDEKALAKIKDGWSVSCAFDSDDTGPAGEWLANKYDFEIVDGHFTHLALVPNPRYEDSKIFANQKCFINSKEASMVKDNAKGKENNKVSGAELKQILGADGWAGEAKDPGLAVRALKEALSNTRDMRYRQILEAAIDALKREGLNSKVNDAFGPNIIRVTFRTKRGSTEDKYKLTEEFSSEANAKLRASALNWDIISSEQIKQNAKVKLYMKTNAELKCPGCGGTNIQKAEGYKLNKCLSCHLAFDTAEENAKKNAEGWVPQFKAWLKTVGDANGKDYATMEKMWEKHAQMNYDQSPTTFEFLEWNKLKGPQYNSKENGMRGWDVYLRGKLIDTVFYDDSCDADYVKRGLIDHDGYDPAIEIKGGKKNERKQNSVRMRIVRA